MVTTPAMYRVFLDLLERLGNEPRSVVRARENDDNKLLGWGVTEASLASVVEELRALQRVVVSLVSKKAPKDVEPFELRPFLKVQVKKKAPATMLEAMAALGVPTVRR